MGSLSSRSEPALGSDTPGFKTVPRAKLLSDLQEKITNFTTPLVFFTLELNRLGDGHLDALFAQNAELARYKPVFDRIRAMKPYQLSDELENFLHDLGVVDSRGDQLSSQLMGGWGGVGMTESTRVKNDACIQEGGERSVDGASPGEEHPVDQFAGT